MSRQVQDAYIVAATRTPIGKSGRGYFRNTRPDDLLVAAIGGGSNAIGIFSGFVDERSRLIGVEPAGGAAVTRAQPGVVHGMRSYLMQDEYGQVQEAHSISAGLDYPGVGPEHAHLADVGRAQYHPVTDDEVINAFQVLTRAEGIIPALEPAHERLDLGVVDGGAKRGAERAACPEEAVLLTTARLRGVGDTARVAGASTAPG